MCVCVYVRAFKTFVTTCTVTMPAHLPIKTHCALPTDVQTRSWDTWINWMVIVMYYLLSMECVVMMRGNKNGKNNKKNRSMHRVDTEHCWQTDDHYCWLQAMVKLYFADFKALLTAKKNCTCLTDEKSSEISTSGNQALQFSSFHTEPFCFIISSPSWINCFKCRHCSAFIVHDNVYQLINHLP